MTLAEIERIVISKTLQQTHGNKQAAAQILGIYRPRLYNKIKKYNIETGRRRRRKVKSVSNGDAATSAEPERGPQD
jgi:DNA-binding NtrC family response regulator